MSRLPSATKRLGQNWLVNQGVLDRIADELALDAEDVVVEVGPGTGALTERLAKSGARVIAVEKDHRLLESLRSLLAPYSNASVIEGDILKFDPSVLVQGSWKLVGNIPYYLTSHFIKVALEDWQPALTVVMVQEEVARRLMAQAPQMNLLALGVQLYARPSMVMRVSRGSFRPIPEVDSAVVRLERRTDGPSGDRKQALAMARAAFGHRRKQLTSTIPVETLSAAGIPPAARPQELSPEDWLRLSTIG